MLGGKRGTLKIGARGLDGLRWPSIRVGLDDRPDAANFAAFRAFDDLVVAVEPELRRFVSRKVLPQEVDDVLQEIWVAAWQALPQYDGRSKLRTWLYGICLHKCHDRYRAQRHESRRIPIEDVEVVDGRPSFENNVLRAHVVARLLDRLDEAPREVLELYYYAQMTLAEIATILDRNLNTVKYQFYRAHTTLLEYAESEEVR